jgi:5'-nucleotidase
MRILVTNDDGINSAALVPLARWAKKFGEVTVVAPKIEQSGKSHGIDIINPFEVKKVQLADDIEAYSVDSTPADCVRFAILGLKEKYDFVISGINKGYNIGRDIVYSGTVGAIFEAQNYGIKAMAISTDYTSFESAIENLDLVGEYFKNNELYKYNSLYNVNIPLEVKGIRITRQGGAYYSDEFIPMENDIWRQVGVFVYKYDGNPELDTDSIMDGYISITPLTLERTHVELYEKLKMLNK